MAKKKNRNAIFIAIGNGLLLVLMIGSYYLFFNAPSKGMNPDKDFISLRMYDESGALIDKTTKQSIVNGVAGVYSVDLTVTVTNKGDEVLTCNLVSLSPSAFNSAISKTEKTVPIGGKTAWTSSLINVSSFENITDTLFLATARCKYVIEGRTVTLPDISGSLPVSIESSSVDVGFELSIDLGGTPTEYCGDSVCQVSESASSCPADCVVSNYVTFRTSDLSYVAGTGVAYTSTCGGTLLALGKTTGACSTHNCANADYVFLVPSSSGSVKVWIGSTVSSTDLCICNPGATSGYPARYSATDSDASKVDTSPTSFDSAKEVSC